MKRYILYFCILIISLFFINLNVVNAGGGADDSLTYTVSEDSFEEGYKYGDMVDCNKGTLLEVSGHKMCVKSSFENDSLAFECKDKKTQDWIKFDNVSGSDGNTYEAYGCRKLTDYSKITNEVTGFVGGSIMEISTYPSDTDVYILKGDSVTIKSWATHEELIGAKEGESIVRSVSSVGGTATYYKINVYQANSNFDAYDHDKYIYGDVSDCFTSSGISYFMGIHDFDGHKVCLFNRADKYNDVTRLECGDDPDMERFDLGTIQIDGGIYYGWGCRKLKDESQREYVELTWYVGEGTQLVSYGSGSLIKILEGDSVQKSKHGDGYVEAVKPGVTRIKVGTTSPKYYRFTVIEAPKTLEEFDSNYYYGNVDECDLGGYLGHKEEFNGYIWCLTSAPGYDFKAEGGPYGGTGSTNVTCQNRQFKTFQVEVSINNTLYRGYGCRVLKSEYEALLEAEKINYNKVTCETLFGSEGSYNNTHEILRIVIKFLQYLALILAAVLSIIDFIKVVPTQDKDALRKTMIKALTRLGVAIAIFLVPVLLKFILEIVGISNPLCGLL